MYEIIIDIDNLQNYDINGLNVEFLFSCLPSRVSQNPHSLSSITSENDFYNHD